MNFEDLRDYQKSCIDKLRDGIRGGHRAQVLVAPTGAGKTVIASYLLGEAHNKQTKAFFVCDRVSLVDQTSALLDSYGVPHGVIQAQHWRNRPWEHIQVVSAQTLARRNLSYRPKLLVWDECFVADSMVNTVSGMKPIQFVRSGERVYNAIGVGEVLGVSAKPAGKRKIVTVRFEDGTEIRCTEEHRFFTTESWVQAGRLAGKSVIRIEDVPDLWGGIPANVSQSRKRLDKFSTKEKLGWPKDLLAVLCKEIEEPDALRIISSKNGADIEKNWSQASHPWWKRNGTVAAAAENVRNTWSGLDIGACSELWGGSESKGAVYTLQNRHSEPSKNDGNRTGRRESLLNKKTVTGRKKNKISCGVRVVSVQIEERQSDTVVYNLHISGHPSYFVDGRLVHNCHTGYKSVLDYIKDDNMTVVGLTATPFSKGMGQTFSNVVNSTTTNKLVEEKWLVPLKFYAAQEIDMSGAEINSFGEWKDSEVETRGVKIIGDIVKEWVNKTKLHFDGPVKTIVFSATVAHGDELCRSFQENGYNFQQISYKDGNDDKRRRLIEEFRRPDSSIIGLVSCEALAKGFDVTDIKVGIGARPYRKSLSSHIQQIGRVMRSHPGKDFALWLDHSGNVLRFMDDMETVFANGVDNLNDREFDAKARKEKTEEEKKEMKCAACGFVHTQKICPACGHERVGRKSNIINESGELKEVGKKLKQHEWMENKQLVWGEICYIAYEMKKNDFQAEKLALAQYRQIYGVWPQRKYSPELFIPPRAEVRNKIRSNLVAYWRRISNRRAA